jgi:ABC-type nitrate/sulfonate/bicarbonate transport system substrate-binding protein
MRIAFNELKSKALTVAAAIVVGGLILLIPSKKGICAEQLRVGVFLNLHCALIYLADSQGFFKKHGVDVVIRKYETGPSAISDLTEDKIDIATPAEFAFVVQAFKHRDLRIAATICNGSDHDLVVRKDKGIARPQDLRGKSVAVTHGSSGEFFFHNYLIFNRIPAKSVHLVFRTATESIKALADGKIDAALSWPPYTYEMVKRLGANGSRWPAQSGQEFYMVLLAKEGFLKKQPKTMEQFLAALLDAEQFITKYPDRAQTFLRNILKTEAEAFLDNWSGLDFQIQLSQDLLVLMEREAKWSIRNKLVEKTEMPNYLDFFYFQALEKVKPEAVGIVH